VNIEQQTVGRDAQGSSRSISLTHVAWRTFQTETSVQVVLYCILLLQFEMQADSEINQLETPDLVDVDRFQEQSEGRITRFVS
jgi:hypothetical protein